MSEFPDDADGDVLRRLEEAGFDFTKAYDVDFYCYANDESTAKQILKKSEQIGYVSKIFVDEEDENKSKQYSVYMSVNIKITYAEVMRRQTELDGWLSDYNTRCDGWGGLH